MLSESATKFLKQYPPFNLLDDPSLSALVDRLIMEIYPAGTIILRQGDELSRGLYIIREGSVRIFAGSPGQERFIDYRGVGETFGFLSLGESERLDVSVQAAGDTVCYVADSASVTKLLNEHPLLREYLIPSYFPRHVALSGQKGVWQSALQFGSERVLFTTPVRDLACRDMVTARTDVPIIEAARVMSVHRIGALVLVDEFDRPAGIITSSDLRDRVLVPQTDPAKPVGSIMSSPVITADGADCCFEALLKMMSHGVHHLLVMESGRQAGIISNHDFLVLQGVSPLVIVKEIEDHATVDGLASSAGKVRELISLLHGSGAGAESILRIISTVNDRIERKILDMAIKTLGPPPMPFCWIVYGSAGRKEQTFRTDQDNAIVYGDPSTEGEERSSAEYFGRFAEFVVSAFLRCGFKLCPGGFMASNPAWRQPLSVWKRNFSNWISSPADEALHNAVNLFDFRGLYGELRLASELKKHLMLTLTDQAIFLKALADLTVDYKPPLGVFGSLMLEKDGKYVNHLNLKEKCLTPLINIVRLLSFEAQIPETSTTERIAVLKNIHPVMKRVGDDLQYAFEFMSLLRIRHQLRQAEMGTDPDNFIDPRDLSSLELRNLKEICRLLSRIIDDITLKYGTGTRL